MVCPVLISLIVFPISVHICILSDHPPVEYAGVEASIRALAVEVGRHWQSGEILRLGWSSAILVRG